MNALSKFLHRHKWVEFGQPVKGSDSLNPNHHFMPDVQRYKCECGKVKVKRGDFEHIS